MNLSRAPGLAGFIAPLDLRREKIRIDAEMDAGRASDAGGVGRKPLKRGDHQRAAFEIIPILIELHRITRNVERDRRDAGVERMIAARRIDASDFAPFVLDVLGVAFNAPQGMAERVDEAELPVKAAKAAGNVAAMGIFRVIRRGVERDPVDRRIEGKEPLIPIAPPPIDVVEGEKSRLLRIGAGDMGVERQMIEQGRRSRLHGANDEPKAVDHRSSGRYARFHIKFCAIAKGGRGGSPHAAPCAPPRFDYRIDSVVPGRFVNQLDEMLRRMISRIFNGTTLKSRALKGGVVALSGFGAAQGIRLVSNLIMTRLLAPDAFGLMGVTLALQIWIAMMSDLGLDASIVRSKRGTEPEFLATARTLQLGRCALIAGVLLIAGLALPSLAESGVLREGSVYADERLPVFIFAIAASVMISGFSAMRIALHNRSLDLVPVIRLELAAQVIALAAMAGAALAGAGVYSLAAGAIVAECVKSAGSHFFLKGPPARFGFAREHFDEIFAYGKWLIIASTFGFLAARGDQIIFGWLFDIAAFSLYSIATIWILAGRTLVETVQRRIAYPTLAELHRERAHDMTRVYRRMRLVYELGCLALFAGVVLFADLAVGVLYTDAYQGVAHYMKLLSIVLLLIPYRLLSSVLLTSGDSRRFTIVTILPGAVLFGATPFIFDRFGADAAIVFAALTPALAIPFNWKFASKFIKIDHARESVMALVAFAAGALLLRFA